MENGNVRNYYGFRDSPYLAGRMPGVGDIVSEAVAEMPVQDGGWAPAAPKASNKLGTGAGAALGFVMGGPVGAAIGAGAGYLGSKWLKK